MKKLFALILSLAMLFALAACGSSESTPELTRGTVNGSRYESSFLGVGCELDSSWTVSSDEELAELMGQAVENLENPDKYQKMLESASIIQDFNAVHSSGASVNIVFEKLSGANRLLDEDQYCDLSIPTLETTYTDLGLNDVKAEKNEFSFAGVTHPGSLTTGTIYGISYYCQQIYIKNGSYMGVVTITCFNESDIAAIAGYFYALDK